MKLHSARNDNSDVRVSVVSGTYNRLPLLQRMVASVRESVKKLSYEIVLVDGGSTDGSIKWCEAQEDITLIQHGELLGAIKAFNDGFAAAQGRYVVMGNDDIVFGKDTIARAYEFLQGHPKCGQVAFASIYKRRENLRLQPTVQGMFGYNYAQCGMTRRWLGDLAGWWGNEGMHTYGGDTRLSLRIWEMGWSVKSIDGCFVVDEEYEDELRRINSDTPWARAKARGEIHPDLAVFAKVWEGRMPSRENWRSAPINRVVMKAQLGSLRTLRFKETMLTHTATRVALIDAFKEFGPTRQVNQSVEFARRGKDDFQKWTVETIRVFKPDLVLFQSTNDNRQSVRTIGEIRNTFPNTFLINWDGDTHYPLKKYHFEIANAVHLQLTISPTLFPQYIERGAANIGYWPIGVEQQFLDMQRAAHPQGPDVLFLAALYGQGVFPEAETRRDAALALAESELNLELFGFGWDKVGLEAGTSYEDHVGNAQRYSEAKMALSISQTADYWGYTSDRLYNITATGCPALMQHFPGMEEHGYVDGETCIAWNSVEEMLDKARYYVAHDEEREEIGRRGREMTHARHTWKHRVLGLFAMLEGLQGDKR